MVHRFLCVRDQHQLSRCICSIQLQTCYPVVPTVVSWCSHYWQNRIYSIKLRAASFPWLRADRGQRGKTGGLSAAREYNLEQQTTGEVLEKSDVSKREEAATWKERRKLGIHQCSPWEMLCIWDPREITQRSWMHAFWEMPTLPSKHLSPAEFPSFIS